MTGPRASARPDTAAHTPSASARVSRSGYTCLMMESVPGSLAAAPIPMIDPTGDEPIDVARQRGHDGAATEDGDADQHDPLAAEDVAEHPGDEHEAGECERVAVDHPLQRGDPGVQIALHVGQADADDGVVQEGEEEDSAQGGQRKGLRGGDRARPRLMSNPGGAPSLPWEAWDPLASAGRASMRHRIASGVRGMAVSWARVLRTQGAGSGIPTGCREAGPQVRPHAVIPRTVGRVGVLGPGVGGRAVRCSTAQQAHRR